MGAGREKGFHFMIFGRTNRQQAQNGTPAAGMSSTAGAGMPPEGQQASAWTGAGYPAQPAGTGYAGYTPGSAQQGAGYAAGAYGTQGTAGYPGAAYGNYSQPVQGYAQSAQNAGQPGSGYAQQQAYGQGYASPSYGQAQGYGQQSYGQGGYTYPQGYAQPAQGYGQGTGTQGGYTYPQMNPGAYAQQQGSGAQPQSYAQGGSYNPYAQMGRNQAQPGPDYSRQIPLNGGGYVPPAVPVKKQPFVFQTWMLIALGAVLAVLFAAGLFLSQMKILLWVFLALAVGSILFFWIRPLISGNRRLCYTIIFGVLSAVALLSGLGLLSPRADATRTPAQVPAETAQPGGGSTGANAGGTVIDPQTGAVISAVSQTEATPTPTPAADDNATTDRLESFFRYWSANRYDEMLTLCAPSWQSGVDNPKTALFGLMANRTPQDYTVEKVSGTVDDTSRTVTVVSTMDRNNGKDPVKYRLGVLMIKESDQWYVDPQSLKTYEAADTPDPSITDTPAPTAEPLVNASTVLYYNPDGGTKYHLDQNCKSTHAKYLPMKGHFTYGEINDDKYVKLTPCNVCGAPLRP